MGPVGFGLMVFMARLGKQARTQRQAGESFAVAKLKHGRAADLIIYLVFIHAFLGFIYTFDVLMWSQPPAGGPAQNRQGRSTQKMVLNNQPKVDWSPGPR